MPILTTTKSGAAAVLALAAHALVGVSPDAGPAFEITRFTVDCGGGVSAGGIFELNGTIGQHDAQQALAGAHSKPRPGSGGWTIPTPPASATSMTAARSVGRISACCSEHGTATNAELDPSGDGSIDGADLGLLLGAWGACP